MSSLFLLSAAWCWLLVSCFRFGLGDLFGYSRGNNRLKTWPWRMVRTALGSSLYFAGDYLQPCLYTICMYNLHLQIEGWTNRYQIGRSAEYCTMFKYFPSACGVIWDTTGISSHIYFLVFCETKDHLVGVKKWSFRVKTSKDIGIVIVPIMETTTPRETTRGFLHVYWVWLIQLEWPSKIPVGFCVLASQHSPIYNSV